MMLVRTGSLSIKSALCLPIYEGPEGSPAARPVADHGEVRRRQEERSEMVYLHFADDNPEGMAEIRSLFGDAEDYAEYSAHFLDAFNQFIGKHGRQAASYEQQHEAARLSAVNLVTDARFHMRFQHRSEKENIAMVTAMLYWRGYKDILPVDEAERRLDAYIETMPVLGRVRMGRTLR